MNWKFWKKEKPRVFLGTLRIIPRDDFNRHLEVWDVETRNRVALRIYDYLEEFFELPLVSEIEKPVRSDLGLDITVLSWQLGQAKELRLGVWSIPLVWRPKIVVQARLFFLRTGKNKSSYIVTEKMTWGVFIDRVYSWRNFFNRFSIRFEENDIKYLLYQASIKVLKKTAQTV